MVTDGGPVMDGWIPRRNFLKHEDIAQCILIKFERDVGHVAGHVAHVVEDAVDLRLRAHVVGIGLHDDSCKRRAALDAVGHADILLAYALQIFLCHLQLGSGWSYDGFRPSSTAGGIEHVVDAGFRLAPVYDHVRLVNELAQ